MHEKETAHGDGPKATATALHPNHHPHLPHQISDAEQNSNRLPLHPMLHPFIYDPSMIGRLPLALPLPALQQQHLNGNINNENANNAFDTKRLDAQQKMAANLGYSAAYYNQHSQQQFQPQQHPHLHPQHPHLYQQRLQPHNTVEHHIMHNTSSTSSSSASSTSSICSDQMYATTMSDMHNISAAGTMASPGSNHNNNNISNGSSTLANNKSAAAVAAADLMISHLHKQRDLHMLRQNQTDIFIVNNNNAGEFAAAAAAAAAAVTHARPDSTANTKARGGNISGNGGGGGATTTPTTKRPHRCFEVSSVMCFVSFHYHTIPILDEIIMLAHRSHAYSICSDGRVHSVRVELLLHAVHSCA